MVEPPFARPDERDIQASRNAASTRWDAAECKVRSQVRSAELATADSLDDGRDYEEQEGFRISTNDFLSKLSLLGRCRPDHVGMVDAPATTHTTLLRSSSSDIAALLASAPAMPRSQGPASEAGRSLARDWNRQLSAAPYSLDAV